MYIYDSNSIEVTRQLISLIAPSTRREMFRIMYKKGAHEGIGVTQGEVNLFVNTTWPYISESFKLFVKHGILKPLPKYGKKQRTKYIFTYKGKLLFLMINDLAKVYLAAQSEIEQTTLNKNNVLEKE